MDDFVLQLNDGRCPTYCCWHQYWEIFFFGEKVKTYILHQKGEPRDPHRTVINTKYCGAFVHTLLRLYWTYRQFLPNHDIVNYMFPCVMYLYQKK